MHLVRNSIDHGLEMPTSAAVRARTRPARSRWQPRIEAPYRHRSRDDGRGLDRAKIWPRLTNDLAVPDNRPIHRVWDLIFQPGFSTADAVTDLSGRGVGMDVVRRNIQALGGECRSKAAFGTGTAR